MKKENAEKKQSKLVSGTKVKVSTVAIVSVLLAVLLALSSFGFAVFSSNAYEYNDGKLTMYELKSKLYTKAVIKALPNKITGNDGGKKIDFYIEENDNYNPETNVPVEQYRVYYYKDGKKLTASGGVYRGDYETMYPLIGFFIKGMDNLKVLKGVFLTLVIVSCMAIVVLLIWLLYLFVRIKQERKYNADFQAKKQTKKNQKNISE